MCGKCNEQRPDGAATAVLAAGESPDAVVQPIRATIQPGFDAKVSIRIVPGRDILTTPPRPACQPRGDRPFVVRPIPYDPDLITKLTEANASVSAWLAKDESNAKAFLDDPVAALAEAGVELTRAEARSVSRSHAVMKDDAVLPPGAQISALEVVAVKRGKVGDRKPTDRPNDRPEDKPHDTTHDRPTDKPTADRGCGCG
jgi:hypothetical protein